MLVPRLSRQCVSRLIYLLRNDHEMKRSILGLVACMHLLLLSGGRCTAQAVNGRGFTGEVLKQAIRGAKGTTEPIELIVSTDNEFRTVRLSYHDGEKYPRLKRVEGTPDLLDEILKPLAPGKGSGL